MEKSQVLNLGSFQASTGFGEDSLLLVFVESCSRQVLQGERCCLEL
jgi:hypothetical protein